MQILDNSLVNINYYSEEDCIAFFWKGFVSGENLRDIYLKTIQAIDKCPENWLLDKKNMTVISPEDQEWLSSFWATKEINGCPKVAFIDSLNPFGKISIRNIVSELNTSGRGIETEIFETKQEAINWLETSDNKIIIES